MTEQDKTWFENLHQSRNSIANTLKDSFAIGNIWNSVVEKYSDQAHLQKISLIGVLEMKFIFLVMIYINILKPSLIHSLLI